MPVIGLLALFTAVCTVILVLLTMLLNEWQAGFYNHLQQYNPTGFLQCLAEFLGVAGIFTLVSGYQSYFRLLLTIRWRQWLTDRYIALWLQNQTYYQLHFLDETVNPDQRISEDVEAFTAATVELGAGLLRHAVMLLVFSAVLWQRSGSLSLAAGGLTFSIPGYLFWLALFYSLAGTWLTVRSGKPLIAGNIARQSSEAAFRSYLSRIREYDECIALYGGERAERRYLAHFFTKITHDCLSLAASTRQVAAITSGYSQLSVVFAFLAASPLYFSQKVSLGQLFEISGAYWYVHSALSYIVESYGKLALWRALSLRLQAFRRQMKDACRLAQPQGLLETNNGRYLRFSHLTLYSSARQPLVSSLTLELKRGDKLLISGLSGSGKSTLLRTMAGLWPYYAGRISLPPRGQLMFLPQKPYIPAHSLREALLYPGFCRRDVSDARLGEVLGCCNLSLLASQLDQHNEWSRLLSLGEQQRLAFARVLLAEPSWLFLDEATSSLDEKSEGQLYALVAQMLPDTTIISVGHRESLRRFHSHSLVIEENGSWRFSSLTSAYGIGCKTCLLPKTGDRSKRFR